MASNNLGELVLPDGWTRKAEKFLGKRQSVFTRADGTKQVEHPGKPEGIIALANAIPDMRALTSLNLSNNNLGQLVLPVGWTKEFMYDKFKGYGYKHIDGREQKDPTEPGGIIVLASALKDMRAMTSLDLSSNTIGSEGAVHVAEAIKVKKCVVAVVLVPKSC
jgi:hypothetical protein